MDIVSLLAELGGVASREQLLERGATGWELGRACHQGRIMRVRRAWYATPVADRPTVLAVRVGGMLTCVSLLHAVGVWAPQTSDIHVSVARNASRLRSVGSRRVPLETEPNGAVIHWRGAAGATITARDSVLGALTELCECANAEDSVAAIDSALHLGLVERAELCAAGIPHRALALADGRSESGAESLVRLRLRAKGIGCRIQVSIPSVGRVDLLLGDRLVLEVDGYAFHGDREAFERDRARDLRLVALGYLVIRVSYRQVIDDWPRAERAIIAIVRSRRHRWPRRQ